MQYNNISQGGRHDKRRKFQFTKHKQSILSLDKNDTLNLDNYMLFTFQDKSILSQYKVAQDELALIHESISKNFLWFQCNLQNMKRVGNHGGSPPILGLKRGHPRAWGNKV